MMLAAGKAWDEALAMGNRSGYRNAQVTVLAPTGTIGFMMDCDTTGVEPDIALVKYKRLTGGGMLKIVNRSVGEALRRLGYGGQEAEVMLAWLERVGTLEGAPRLEERHLAVFDCAFPSEGGGTQHPAHGPPAHDGGGSALPVRGHLQDGEHAQGGPVAANRGIYMEAWKLGLKAVAVYRDGCKRTQPLSTPPPGLPPRKPAAPAAFRTSGGNHPQVHHRRPRGYVTVGMYEDGSPGSCSSSWPKKAR